MLTRLESPEINPVISRAYGAIFNSRGHKSHCRKQKVLIRGTMLNNKPKMTEIFCTVHPLLYDAALFVQSLQHPIVFLSLMSVFSEDACEGSCCCYSHLIGGI